VGVELLNAMDLVALRSDAARWGLTAGVATEGEEDVARLGLTYRVPRRGETAAQLAETESGIDHRRRELEVQLAALETRLASARSVLAGSVEGLEAGHLEGALRALEVLVEEGKAGLGEVLAERRGLIEARGIGVDRRATVALAAAQVRALTRGMSR
jgi:hypothetical protein